MTYVVPFDFTPATENAMAYGLHVAATFDREVMLLHIVKKESEVADAEARLQEVVNQQSAEDQGRMKVKAVVGNIFEDIAKIADVVDAQLIVMGTHGMKGMQKLFGSNAIKVITSSVVPFVVVQENMRPATSVNKIVMPFDLSKESVQILSFATELAKKYDAEIHLLGGEQTDEWLIKKSHSNIKFATDYLRKNGVRHKVELLPRRKDFHEEVIKYAVENGVDLIAVGYIRESVLPQFDTFTQSLITNEVGLPVMVVNAEDILSVNSQYTFLTV